MHLKIIFWLEFLCLFYKRLFSFLECWWCLTTLGLMLIAKGSLRLPWLRMTAAYPFARLISSCSPTAGEGEEKNNNDHALLSRLLWEDKLFLNCEVCVFFYLNNYCFTPTSFLHHLHLFLLLKKKKSRQANDGFYWYRKSVLPYSLKKIIYICIYINYFFPLSLSRLSYFCLYHK